MYRQTVAAAMKQATRGRDGMSKTSVLFVCMGNICRSPTAEGVFRHHVESAGLADRIEVDSAGTHAYHVGEPPDHRARAAAERRGMSLDGIRARRVSSADFERFDYIIAMDEDNLFRLRDEAPDGHAAVIRVFLEFASGCVRVVRDQFFGGAGGFERVLDLVVEASQGLLKALSRD